MGIDSRGLKGQQHHQRTERPRIRAARLPDLSIVPVLFFTFLLLLFLVAGKTLGAPQPAKNLEVRVWTADEGDLPQIEQEAVRVIQLAPYSPEAYSLLSTVYLRMFEKNPGDLQLLKAASDLAQQAIDLAPKADHGYVALANVLDTMGNTERAIVLLNDSESSGIEPSWRFYFMRARLTTEEAELKNALKYLRTALAFTDTQNDILVPYVVALLQAESSGAELIQQLDEWDSSFPSPLFQLTKAIALSDIGKYQDAFALYTRLVFENPEMKEAKVNRAILMYKHLKRASEATSELNTVLAAHQGKLTRGTESMIRVHLGAAYLSQKKYTESQREFVSAAHLDPSNLGILDFITTRYKDLGAHAEMVNLIEEMNSAIPGTGLLHALLGETLSEKLNQHDKAVKAFRDAITLEPERSDYYNGMGLAYYRKRDYTTALKLFMTATEINPSDATARYNEACVLSLLSRPEEALASLGDALSLDPTLTQHAEGDEDFANIRSTSRFRELVRESAATVGH